MRFVYCNGHNSTSLFFRFARKEEKMNISIKEETLGQRLRAQRIRLGMTQEELAEALYVEKSIISYYENDKKEMRASGLAEIAKVLQTTPNYLLGFADNNDGFADEAFVARCEGSVCKRDSFEVDQGTDLKNVLLLSAH